MCIANETNYNSEYPYRNSFNEKSVKEKNNQKHEDNVEDIGNDIKKEREKGWTHKRAKRVSFALDPLSKEGEKERGSLAWRG